ATAREICPARALLANCKIRAPPFSNRSFVKVKSVFARGLSRHSTRRENARGFDKPTAWRCQSQDESGRMPCRAMLENFRAAQLFRRARLQARVCHKEKMECPSRARRPVHPASPKKAAGWKVHLARAASSPRCRCRG